MIFVIVGSQKFQFNRLIIEVDRLKQEGILQDRVVAQIGACDYEPKHIEWKRFMDKEDFDAHIAACDLLITHAGEGSIMTGLLRQRKVIAVPRYERFGEHVSDHQLEIARALATEPKLLLLDEPAAGMNPNETKELMDTIRFVRDEFKMTILLIEHDMKLVSGICEKLTVLNFGQVLAQGDTSTVLNDPRVITAYLGE